MRIETERALLRIHLSNQVRLHGQPLYEYLVERARRGHLRGATVLKGVAGYLDHGPVLIAGVKDTGSERPMVVEFVDAPEALEKFLDELTPVLRQHPALVTLERARIVDYTGGAEP